MNIKYDKIIINIPEQLLKAFDDCCETAYFTRSEGLKQAMRDFIAISRGEDYLPPKQQKEQMLMVFKSMIEAGQELSKDPKYAQLNQQKQPEKLSKLSSKQVLSKQKYESPQIKKAKTKHMIEGYKKIMAQKKNLLEL